MVDGHVRFPLTRTYMGGANYLKLSQQIINAWKTAFTIPTEKQRRCLERATQVDRSHTFGMIKSRILAATIQVGYRLTRCRSLSTVYRRKRDKREVKRDSGT